MASQRPARRFLVETSLHGCRYARKRNQLVAAECQVAASVAVDDVLPDGTQVGGVEIGEAILVEGSTPFQFEFGVCAIHADWQA